MTFFLSRLLSPGDKSISDQLSLEGEEHRVKATRMGVQPRPTLDPPVPEQHPRALWATRSVATGPAGAGCRPSLGHRDPRSPEFLSYLLAGHFDAKALVHHTGCVSGPSLLDAESLVVSLHSPVMLMVPMWSFLSIFFKLKYSVKLMMLC